VFTTFTDATRLFASWLNGPVASAITTPMPPNARDTSRA
jgi:hypothetical protein